MPAEDQQRVGVARQLLELAHDLEQRGELANAVRLFGQSLNAYPTVEAHLMRGRVLEALGRYTPALADYREAQALAPDSAEASSGVARVRGKSN